MKKHFKNFLLTIVFLTIGIFVSVNQVYAETEVSGNISTDTVWALANSPYVITGTVQIPENITLTIEPGVIVKFNKNTGLFVGGKLTANGNANNHIIFTSNQNTPQFSDWDRIKFIQTAERLVVDTDKNYVSGSILNYCDIQYGGRTLDIDNGVPYISNSNLNNNYQLILYSNLAGVLNNSTIENNGRVDVGRNYSMINSTVKNNQEFYGQDSGIIKYSTLNNNNKLTLSNSTIIGNNIFSNKTSEGLIRISQDVTTHEIRLNIFRENGDSTNNLMEIEYGNREVNFNVSNNNIIGDNNKYFINNKNNSSFTSQYDFSKNYWGTTNTQEINSKIYDYYDDITYGKVNYEPYGLAELKFNETDTFSQPSACTSWTYSNWGTCTNGQQTRTIVSSSPNGCVGGSPVLTQSCTYTAAPTFTYIRYWPSSPIAGQSTSIGALAVDDYLLANTKLYLDGVNVQTCDFSGRGFASADCSFTSTTLSVGNHSYYAVATDSVGNTTRDPLEGTMSFTVASAPGTIATTCISFTYSDWSSCQSNGTKTRSVVSSSPSSCSNGSPVLTQSCTYIAPVCSSWTYSDWSICSNGQQTRNIISSLPTGCAGGISNITRSCTVNTPNNENEQEQTCSSFTYSNWSNCSQDNIQSRSALSGLPNNCSGGQPTLNQTCIYVADQVNTSQADINKTNNEEKSAEVSVVVAEVINREQSLAVKKDTQLTNRLKGKILLQVESVGEAWYVSPSDGKKIYMANGNEAYQIMRNEGIGISNKDLGKINTDKTFAKKNNGKIFLQVEARGEAYYIDSNGVAHYLKDGIAAYEVMRSLGLGISNKDIRKIEVDN